LALDDRVLIAITEFFSEIKEHHWTLFHTVTYDVLLIDIEAQMMKTIFSN
jgi:hypothetical protein